MIECGEVLAGNLSAQYRARMTPIKDLAQLGKQIAAQHGWAAAKAFKAYEMNDSDRAVLSQCALDLLKVFPPMPGACALMSASLVIIACAPTHATIGTTTRYSPYWRSMRRSIRRTRGPGRGCAPPLPCKTIAPAAAQLT